MEVKLELGKEDWRVFNGYLCKKVSAKNKALFDNFFINVFVWMVIGYFALTHTGRMAASPTPIFA